VVESRFEESERLVVCCDRRLDHFAIEFRLRSFLQGAPPGKPGKRLAGCDWASAGLRKDKIHKPEDEVRSLFGFTLSCMDYVLTRGGSFAI
jgi:hypothetical protein